MTITKCTPGHPYELYVDREDLEQNGLHARLYTRDPGGCWAVYAYDVGPYLVSTHPSEVGALRAAVSYAASADVVWLPWGLGLTDAIKQSETTKAQA